LATPIWRSKETIQRIVKVLELGTTVATQVQSGRRDIGLANSGKVVYNRVDI